MTAPLKIFILSSHLKTMGGAEKNVLDLSRGLKERCHVEVGGLQCGDVLEAVRKLGVTAHDLNVTHLLSFSSLARAFWFRRKLKREKFDLLLTYHHDADMWGGLIAASAGIPVVSSRRDMGFMLSFWHVWVYRFLNGLFRRIVTVSEAVRAEIIRTQWAPRDRIAVVHNGLDIVPAAEDGADVRRELGLHPTRPIVGTVANFRPIKGQEFFVQAAVEVARHRDEAQFVVVGSKDSDYYRLVEKMIAEAGLQDRFICVGERSDVHRVLSAFDIFVLSSVQEGFSNALVEAMSLGIAPVAAEVGGNPEAIEHGRNGFLFAAKDFRSLARHLLTLLGDDELRERMGMAAAATVQARFSFNVMIDRVQEVLTDAVQDQKEFVSTPVSARKG